MKKTIDNTLIDRVALSEFAHYGYRAASTNRIAQKAGVSKGLIFKRYPSKKNLYWSLQLAALDAMVTEMQKITFAANDDALTRIAGVAAWKIKYAEEHPEATKLMIEAFTSPPSMIPPEYLAHLDRISQFGIQSLFKDVPLDRIDPQYSRDDVLRNISWAAESLRAVMAKPGASVASLEEMKETALDFLKIVMKGMER